MERGSLSVADEGKAEGDKIIDKLAISTRSLAHTEDTGAHVLLDVKSTLA